MLKNVVTLEDCVVVMWGRRYVIRGLNMCVGHKLLFRPKCKRPVNTHHCHINQDFTSEQGNKEVKLRSKKIFLINP